MWVCSISACSGGLSDGDSGSGVMDGSITSTGAEAIEAANICICARIAPEPEPALEPAEAADAAEGGVWKCHTRVMPAVSIAIRLVIAVSDGADEEEDEEDTEDGEN